MPAGADDGPQDIWGVSMDDEPAGGEAEVYLHLLCVFMSSQTDDAHAAPQHRRR